MTKMYDVLVKLGILTGKDKGKDIGFESLRDANNHMASCCGIYCCKGSTGLRMDDRVQTSLIGEIYWENNNLMVRRPDGTIGTITIT